MERQNPGSRASRRTSRASSSSRATSTLTCSSTSTSSKKAEPLRARRRGAYSPGGPLRLLGVDDLVPELGVLLLVLRPDLLFGDLAERGDVGLVDLHALGLEDLLGLGEVVDALG